MKKIIKVRIYQMSNGLHLQFFIALVDLIMKFEFIMQKIGVLLNILRACVEREDISYKVVRKSDLSELKADKDRARDDIVAAIKNMLKSLLLHFDENAREAARRIKIVFDAYDKPTPIINLPYDVETVAINNLVQELENKYADDIQLTGLTDWVKELAVRNNDFDLLTKSYNEQLAEKTTLRPKETRQATDNAYKDIVTAIEGFIVMEMKENNLKDETESEYYPFLSELNNLITHYNNQLAQHLGRLEAKNKKEKKNNDQEAEISD
ncbi:MAG: DUF6261 family protein [Bacteroidales bacterium]|jgi:hypothetical protein|nr:DUF6261 family protein [Bacteroidales bacterium]